MTDCNRVFIDTAPIVYFLENNNYFGEKAGMIFKLLRSSKTEMVMSTITCMEYLVHPYRNNVPEDVDLLFKFIDKSGIYVIDIDLNVAKLAAQIRAETPAFKAMDSLQLSAAFRSGCDTFLTNDKQLKQFKHLKIISIDEWEC